MRIEHLEYIAAVTRFGSLRRASEQLHISQPALSEAISKLERDLAVSLLDRHRSGARLSSAGRELLQPIVDVLEAVERLRVAAGDQLATRRLLRIGTVNAGTATLVLPAVRVFQARHTGAAVEIRNLQQDEIQLGLADGVLDLGLVNLLDGDDVPPELESTTLVSGRPVAVLPAAHPLARAAQVTVDDLRREPFVAMRSGYIMYRFAHRLFGASLPTEWHSTDGAEMGKMMVAEGIGLTVLPDYSVVGDPMERAGIITARPIADEPAVIAIRMVALHRRQARVPEVVRDLITQLQSQARHPRAAERPQSQSRSRCVRLPEGSQAVRGEIGEGGIAVDGHE
ncbi:transcriptional regulator [Frankia sp. EI5c]|uniref:LysR family transcriptional regulator n=1 Tax=Frankia sp. EI5c TaxID=683316 RepID=UPI0007C3FB77|nr:LysR family transcriptional regulator [Frankia sp. EI5c]OAA27496.1 transcriptional regulator [Frankia sp. EI5c]